MVKYVCCWMGIQLNHGPVFHARSQGAVERSGGWLHDILVELCTSWPMRRDKYVDPTLYILCTTPDTSLPTHSTLFDLFFGRDSRTQLDRDWRLDYLITLSNNRGKVSKRSKR